MLWSLALLGITTAVFLLEAVLGAPFVKLFAFTPVLAFQQPWTFITAIFLHAGLAHLLFNMLALLLFGPLLEAHFGQRRFLGIYLAGGIAGNIGYMLTASNPAVAGLGASGAIFAVLGSLAVLEPNMVVFVGFLPLPMYLAAVFWFVTELAFLGAEDFVARGAHLLGLLFGVAYAVAWSRRLLPKQL